MNQKSEEQAASERKARVESRLVYQGKVIKVQADKYVGTSGSQRHFDIILHPGAVVIVPITTQGNLLLVKQWRRAVDKIMLELPAGALDSKFPNECAQRELQEETGFKAHKLTPLGGFYSAPGFCTEYLHLFLAEKLVESKLPEDEDEAIDLVEVSLQEAMAMIEDGRICDAKTIAGILRYKVRVSS